MTISSVTKMWSRDSSTAKTENGRQISFDASEAYQVVHTRDTVIQVDCIGPEAIALGLPKAGDLFPGTSFVFAKEGVPQRVSPLLTIVTVNYSGSIGPQGAKDSPLNQPPDYNFRSKTQWAETDEDFDGKPTVTANNEPVTGVMRPITDKVLTVKRNFREVDPTLADLYTQCVNSDTIIIPGFIGSYAPGRALLTSWSAHPVFGDNGGYIEVQAEIEFRTPYRTTAERAWWARVRHEGLMVRTTRGGTSFVSYATDDDKAHVSKPILLKEDGTRETDPNNAFWKEFKVVGVMPYNALGLW